MTGKLLFSCCLLVVLWESTFSLNLNTSSPISIEVLSYNMITCKSKCLSPTCATKIKVLEESTPNMAAIVGKFAIFTQSGVMLTLCYSNTVKNGLPHHQWKTRVFQSSQGQDGMLQVRSLTLKKKKGEASLNPMINVTHNSKNSQLTVNCSITYPISEDQMFIMMRIFPSGKKEPIIIDPKNLMGSLEAKEKTVKLTYYHRFIYGPDYLHNRFECIAFDHNLKSNKSALTHVFSFERELASVLTMRWEGRPITLPSNTSLLDYKDLVDNTSITCEENIGVPKPDIYWIDGNENTILSNRIEITRGGSNYYCCYANQTLTRKSIIRKQCIGAKLTYKDCSEIKRVNKNATSGIYEIYLNRKTIRVFCDMEKSDEQWIVIQKRINGIQSFDKNWIEYKKGFGNLGQEHWLGNENIHQFTKRGPMKIRFDFYDNGDVFWYAEYDRFSVGDEESDYKLTIGLYSGDAGDAMTYASQSLNGMKFSTSDRDNDLSSGSCSRGYGYSGWWFANCGYTFLNDDHFHSGRYYKLKWQYSRYSSRTIKQVEMKIKYI